MAGHKRMTPKVKVFLEAYGGVAKLNAAEAARIAFGGSGAAKHINAKRMRKLWPLEMEQVEEAYRAKFRLTDDELDDNIREIAVDKQHKDRLRALELIARMKGRLNDKLQVTIDRKSMMQEINQLLMILPVKSAVSEDEELPKLLPS